MKILNLKMSNFRSIKELTINFDGKDTDIFGANGTGKTTVANAICWLLIDRPATEEADFDPKTIGAHGVKHSAEITLALDDGQELLLAKEFYEKWTRKRGAAEAEFTGNVTDYYIDGVSVKKKEYMATVEQACGVDIEKLKMLLVLGYFADTMKTEDKRKILFELAGEFTDEDVFAKKPDLKDLASYLIMPGSTNKTYTIEQWRKIAADQRSSLNKKLELLPTRIDEAQKLIPEDMADEAALLNKLQALDEERTKIEEARASLNTADGQKESLRAAISGLEVDLATKRAEYIKKSGDANSKINAAIDELNTERRTLADDLDALKRQQKASETDCAQMKAERERLMKEYADVQAKQWDHGQETCPSCGQPLPADRIEELRAAFNEEKSKQKALINQRGQACSSDKIAAEEARIDEAKAKIPAMEEKLKECQQRIENLRESLTDAPAFETTDAYWEITNRINDLRAKLQAGVGAPDETAKVYEEKLQSVKKEIQSVTMRIAQARAAKDSQKRVADLEQELRDTSATLENIERGIHLCEEFTRTKAAMITDSVNGHFRFVRFVLFRDQINGGLKEICEPTVENKDGAWVEYRSVNYAAQVNAKLDIIDTLNRHYKTNLPIIMDQGESVTNPLPVSEQLIRLIVSAPDTDSLRIKVKD